ncbi:MAG: methyltransferase C-terminal domain-containing protein [Pseudonocardiaceae bacterium]
MSVQAPRCRGCDSGDVGQVVDLGPQPGADYFPPMSSSGDDPRWPLELWFCRVCTLVQLGPVEPRVPEPALAVESATSLAHAATSVRDLVRDYPEISGATVVEFDSHHGGSWLQHLLAAGCRTVADGERAHLVVDVHGLAHEPAIGRCMAERVERLAPGGLLVLEFHHLLPLLVDSQFDTVRHGHWSYLSLGALSRLAVPLGLTVVSVRQVPLFGGSLQVMLRHADADGDLGMADASVTAVLDDEAAAGVDDPDRLGGLHTAAHRSATALHDYLVAARDTGRTVLGYGAPSKAPVLLDISRVGPDLLPFTVDAAPGKHGRRIPGAAVPIRPVEDLRAARPDVVLILTWDIADEVISALEAGGGWGAEYLVPMPAPHVVTR